MHLSDASRSDLLLLVVTLLAAISWMFSREAIFLMPPLLFVAVRFLLAGLVLSLIGHRHLRELTAGDFFRSIRIGLVFGVGMCCWIMGLKHASHVGEGAFLTCLSAIMVPVISRLFFREAQPLSTWLAIPVAVAGLALLSLKNGFRPETGQVYFVLAATIFALYFILNTRAANVVSRTDAAGNTIVQARIPVIVLTSLALLTVGSVGMALSWLLEPWALAQGGLSMGLAGWVLASALIGTAARFFVQTYAQSLSPHSHGVVILIVEPVWVALIAALWFGETMSGIQLAGCMVIFLALVINRWRLVGRWIRSAFGL